jgi:hypothetical protein
MALHLSKFIHTETGKRIMSILLGLGLASLFRIVCKDKNCLLFHAPPLDEIKEKIYKSHGKCVKYNAVATKCDPKKKTLSFE